MQSENAADKTGSAGTEDYAKNNRIQTPSINLPRGGGAIKSIDEKFQVNAVNGTSSFSLPIPVSGARGFTPSVELTYDSGAGNGIFGIGWSLSLPSIRRKTENELPQYLDAIDSDIFILSGSEDLVPEYKRSAQGDLLTDAGGNYIFLESDVQLNNNSFTVRRYRPRIEGAFSRIERWTAQSNNNVHWRTISKDNLTSVFGISPASRITDPFDNTRVFEWFLEFSYNDKGNCSWYEYKPEDAAGIPLAPHNNNRLNGNTAFTNTYLKRIHSGNMTPYSSNGDNIPPAGQYFFVSVLDYGENDPVKVPFNETGPWTFRPDAFSSYRSGFEIRTCRLCRRILLYHYFKELPVGSALIRALSLTYVNNGLDGFTFLATATLTGYTKQDDGATYTQRSFPPFGFDYQKLAWDTQVRELADEALVNAPAGVDGSAWQFTDLYSEGLAGILTEQGNGWFYKHNLGNGAFTPADLVLPKPSFTGLREGLQITDLGGDGNKQLVKWQSEPKGFFELNDDDRWQSFVAFQSIPNIDLGDPDTRQLDLNGDGIADVLITEDEVFRWYPSCGRWGYDASLTLERSYDEEKGPAIVFSDPKETIFLADMSGDGLTDIVRIRNGEVCYWPNLGFGRFGAKVTMDNAPVFDQEDHFNPSYLKLADIDGSGTTDIIYLGTDSYLIWLNQQGNAFTTTPKQIDPFPGIQDLASVTTTDLLGTGLACIVWNSDLPGDANAPLRYIDLMDSLKPHILIHYANNLGKDVYLEYTPSTTYYIADKLAGTPWVTKLHFPVHCVSTVTTYDRIRQTRMVNGYTYHHGYYDHPEKEFRGFGRVDQTDTETIANFIAAGAGAANNISEQDLHQPPVLTKTWFHTGAFLRGKLILDHFEHEYFQNTFVPEKELPEPWLPDGITPEEYQQAIRACKGLLLRKEVYAIDNAANSANPYMTEQHNYLVKLLQPIGQNQYAVFLSHDSESISYQYERNPADPRTIQTFIFDVDEYGDILSSADVAYQRTINPLGADEQQQVHIVYTGNSYTNDVQLDLSYRAPTLYTTIKYEVTGIPAPLPYFAIAALQTACENAAVADFNMPLSPNAQKRIIEITRSNYLSDDTTQILGFGILPSKALLYKQYKAAFNPAMINSLLGTRLTAAELNTALAALTGIDPGNILTPQGGYLTDSIQIAGQAYTYYWLHSTWSTYDPANFFLPVKYTDPIGHPTTIVYDPYQLYIQQITDAKTNTSTVALYNYRTLSPLLLVDTNNNSNAVRFDELGMVVKTFVMGKPGEGDFFDTTSIETGAADQPTTILIYSVGNWFAQVSGISQVDLDDFNYRPIPNVVQVTAFETHYFPDQAPRTRMQVSYSYSDGSGKEIMKKVQAKPDINSPQQPRWIGTGRTILNNKGNPVKQYEPYFSATSAFEDEADLVQQGVTPILHYDPLDRVIRTDYPNGTFSKVEFDGWMQWQYDQNDTVQLYENAVGQPVLPTPWYLANTGPGATPAQIDAAQKTLADNNTPTQVHLDTLGRTFLTIADNGATGQYSTRLQLDIQDNQLLVTDALANPVMQYSYDMAGNKLFQQSMDAGRRWTLKNVLGKPLYHWDDKAQQFGYVYDALNRPLNTALTSAIAANAIFDRIVYGEDLAGGANTNVRGRIYQHYDTAGILTIQYDFKGNLLQNSRQILDKYNYDDHTVPDWSTNPATPDTYITSSAYDALNRVWKLVTPDNSTQYHLFNAAGLLDIVLVDPRGSVVMTAQDESYAALVANTTLNKFVLSIDYNEKGQRSRIVYGNNTITSYGYDPDTFRLVSLVTTDKNNTVTYQNLNYTYDPVGNITQLNDLAQQAIYFGNTLVQPVQDYTYDAIYQLTRALGREHVGQNVLQENNANHNYRDFPFAAAGSLPNPGDTVAMRNYTQKFTYDAVGNILSLVHTGSDGTGYTRSYGYNNTSANHLTNNNRLAGTTIAGDALIPYSYDAHGNSTSMPHLSRMDWDFKDQLYATATTYMSDGNPGTTYYMYDAAGTRVRKVSTAQDTGAIAEERIYLQGYEIYKRYNNDGSTQLERDTLHVMDDQRVIALIETKVTDNGGADQTTLNKAYIRYQYGNHLGSCCLELDDTARIISYEEYHPYGTTSYEARNTAINVVAKRYRYTGLERDEENGFGYHNARYYVPWLGRWTAPDPAGMKDSSNLYEYTQNNPLRFLDKPGTDSIPAEEETFLTGISMSPGVAAAKDADFIALGALFKSRVEEAAKATDLDPGLLTASLFAEPGEGSVSEYRKAYLKDTIKDTDLPTKDKIRGVSSSVIGLDDVKGKKEVLKYRQPGTADSYFLPESVTTPENKNFEKIAKSEGLQEGTPQYDQAVKLYGQILLRDKGKLRIQIQEDKAILVFAKYLKHKQDTVKTILKNEGVEFEKLPEELQFFLTRLKFNPGRVNIKALIRNIKAGKDPLQHNLRTEGRSKTRPIQGATITAAQGLHISKKFFKHQ